MNRLFKKIMSAAGNELIYGAHLVSLGAIGIISTTALLFDLSLNFILLAITYIIFQIIYRYNYFREIKFDLETNPERAKHIVGKKMLMGAILAVYIAVLLCSFFYVNRETFLLIWFLVIGGILYTEQFKKVPLLGFKNYYTSFFWALSIFLVPLFYSSDQISFFLYIFAFIFLRGIVNTVFFDIKDIHSDRRRGLKTLPVYLGKKDTLSLLNIFNLLSLLPLLIGVFSAHLSPAVLLLSSSVIMGFFYLRQTKELNSKTLRTLSYILIDGEYILWPIIVIIGKYII